MHEQAVPEGKQQALPDPFWPYLGTVQARIANPENPVAAYRESLAQGDAQLAARFDADEPVELLVRDRARLVDELLVAAWRHHAGRHAELALIAVGGYGRGELLPCSDIDVMVLLPKSESAQWQPDLERFLTFLWDIGLEVGHSVRTIDDCQREALADVSVATTLIEARLLAGPELLFTAMRRALSQDRVWSSRDFFDAKVREQEQRHHRYHDTAYNLEPNVKQSPGGLRDIQTIGWVAKRHFGADTLDELAAHGFLTEGELTKLKTAQTFLWKVRFALHVVTGRREDRLLFDHQIKLARRFGYEDATYTLAVEQFMQRYYRTAMYVSLANELLLQHFREAILAERGAVPIPINPRFQEREDYLEATSPDVFVRNPSALLELFLVLQQNPQLRGVRADTIRLVGRNLWLIDEEFRQNPRNHRLFLEILCAPAGVTHELRRMNLYGVLGKYIPAFERIVGRMQYDLFHAYTVDAHTLFVVSNLRRFALERYDHEFPKLSQIFRSLPKPELAYMAAIFHDIAKGRGGDHSELGAVYAETFCLEQGLSTYDAHLVAWLVRSHLNLSVTAQKKDTTDPAVIQAFAAQVGDQAHLDYLYVLTVADVRGTNPKLWNSWKASLFDEFYERVKVALRRGAEAPLEQDQLIAETQSRAREMLIAARVPPDVVDRAWESLTATYFLRHTPAEIAWHTGLLAGSDPEDRKPLVAVAAEPGPSGATAIMTCNSFRQHSFARTTAALDQMGLTIVDARIVATSDGRSLDTYLVLEDTGQAITERDRLAEIERNLRRALAEPDSLPTVTRRAPRQVRMFTTATQVSCVEDPHNRRTIVEIVAGDRPGLLSEIAKVLWREDVDLHGAKVVTVGERAEDVFYVTDGAGQPLNEARAAKLSEALVTALDRRDAAA
ncbi:MAG: [protein-PII] uridylyltransferase [Steroidobacteraceae bacterium]|nr:[protein-PII] uridylyltransferase [Steroidobacteraceae bacterium]MCC7199017.1 [protein-PII] uridylyltransferase [Gammaproteobacteria bacterium]